MKTKQEYWEIKERKGTMNIREAKLAVLQGVAVYHPYFEKCNPKIGEYIMLDDGIYDSCLNVEKWDDFWKSLRDDEWKNGWSIWGVSSNFIYSDGIKHFSRIVGGYKNHNIAMAGASVDDLFYTVYTHLKSLLVAKKQIEPCTNYLEEYR